ncbi:MAG: hypothetical protein ABH954_03715 [Candidatus Omnitrophota bacterium]
MKGLVCLLALVFVISGCALVPKEAEKFVVDSDYVKYEQQKSEVEKAYLNDEIDYSQYRNKLAEIEMDRLKSQQEREEILFK